MFFDNIPDEVRKQMEDAHALQRSEQETRHIEMNAWLENLGVHDLVILRRILNTSDDDETRGRFDGVAVALLIFKHRVCENCGVNHEEEELKKLAEGHAAATKADEVMSSSAIDESTMQLMTKYRVKYVGERTETGHPDYRVQCTNCDMIYPNLEDRMVKDPDDCSGCQQKAMWG